MKAIRSTILTWIVIISILVRPTPAEAVVPAVALLAPAVIGASVLATGAATYYAPAIAEASHTAFDTAAAKLSSAAYMTKTIQSTVGTLAKDYVFGKMVDLESGFNDFVDWVRSNPTQAPAAKSAIDSNLSSTTAPYPILAAPDASAALNKIIDIPGLGTRKILALGSLTFQDEISSYLSQDARMSSLGYPYKLGGNQYFSLSMMRFATVVGYALGNPGNCDYYFRTATIQTIALPADLLPDALPVNIPGFNDTYKQSPPATVSNEVNDYVAANPDKVDTPPTFTPAELAQMYEMARAAAYSDYAADLAAQSASDPDNEALALAAAQAAMAANDAAIAAQQAEAETETPPETIIDTPAPLAASPPPSSIDFSPLYDLKDALATHYPFAWLSVLSDYFSVLIASPDAPVFTCPNGFGGSITLDLQSLDTIAAMWRGALLFFMNGICIYAVIRRWS